MNLGFKELKQLRFTILEIAEANKISPDKAVSKFLDDVEKEYDSKLGLRPKLKEKQDEFALMNRISCIIRNNLYLQV